MDKIWDRKSFKVGGHRPLWRGWKNQMIMQNQQKSYAKKTLPTKLASIKFHIFLFRDKFVFNVALR